MCRGIETMRRAFAALDDAVRGINVTERRCIIERNANGFNLVGFFTVYNGFEANYFNVNEDGSVHLARFIGRYDEDEMSDSRVARDFNAPCAVVRHF